MLQDDDKHVFSESDGFDDAIEGNLRSILSLMVIPNHHFVASRAQYQHNKVCLVHHFNYLYRFVQVLYLLLDFVTTGIVLDDFEAGLCGDGEILLRLVARYVLDRRCIWLNMRCAHLLHCLFVHETLLCGYDLPGRS